MDPVDDASAEVVSPAILALIGVALKSVSTPTLWARSSFTMGRA